MGLIDFSRIRQNIVSLGGDPKEKTGGQLVKTLDGILLSLIRKSGRAPNECKNNDCSKIYPHDYPSCPYCGTAQPEDQPVVVTNRLVIPPGMTRLDAYVLKTAKAGRAVMRDLYEIGADFNEINSSGLWEEDKTVDTFAEWVEARTGWSYPTAVRLMRVARTYSSEQIEMTTRIKITGLLEIEKVMRSVPPEQREAATTKALATAETSGQIEAAEVAAIARDVRAELIGEEEAELVEQHQPDEAVIEVTPRAEPAAPKSRKFSVPFDYQKDPGRLSAGDIFRVTLPFGILEVRLDNERADCYLIERT